MGGKITDYGKIVLMVPIVGILIAEILIYSGSALYGLGIYIIIPLIILFLISLSELNIRNILQNLILLVLIRIIYLSIPQFFTVELQHVSIFLIMTVPIYLAIRCQQTYSKSRIFGIYIYLFTSTMAGFLLNILDNNFRPISSDIYVRGELMTIFLIICLLISLLLPDRHLNKEYISDSLNICYISTFLTFAAISVSGIISII